MKMWEFKVHFKNTNGKSEYKVVEAVTDDVDREILIIKNTIKSLGGQYLGIIFRVKEEGNPNKF